MLYLILYIYLAISASCFICMTTMFASVGRFLKETYGEKNPYCSALYYIPACFVASLIPITNISLLAGLIFNYDEVFSAASAKFEDALFED